MMDWLLPEAASAHAATLDRVLAEVHWHMLAVFLIWFVVLVTALVRFRAGRNPEPRANGPRLFWPAIAIAAVVLGDVVLLATRALPAWHDRMGAPPTGAEAPLEIRVAAEQFAWHIHYPGPDGHFGRADAASISASNPVGIDRASPHAADDIGLTNVLVMPVNRPVVILLTARDVVHSFTLPQMRVKQDVTPGFVARTWFTPVKEGAWEIHCSQLCGLGHYRMRGEYRIVSREAWERWVEEEVGRVGS
jgi:cytochrome c oxidase subunit II